MFKVIGKYLPPPPGLKSPALWGMRERLDELFGEPLTIHAVSRHFFFRYRSPQHFIEVFRAWYGPINKAFAELDADPQRQASFAGELLEVIERGNRSRDASLVLPSEYLEVVIERKRPDARR